MLPENPYQSPTQTTIANLAPWDDRRFYPYPTWRCWLLVVSVLPGLATLWLAARNAALHQDDEAAVVSKTLTFLAGQVLIALIAVITILWRSPKIQSVIAMQRPKTWVCLAAIAMLTIESLLSLLISTIALVHIANERKLNFEARDDFYYFLAMFLGAFVGSLAVPLGTWLACDFLGKSRKFHSMWFFIA